MALPTYSINVASEVLRKQEVPAATFTDGMNLGASCAPGIGINMLAGSVVGSPAQFTLIDQHLATRTPQNSQYIGGTGFSNAGTSSGTPGVTGTDPIRFGTPSANGDGSVAFVGNAQLQTLNAGWV